MGTARLAFAFGSAFLGAIFLVLAITPMATGRIEIGPTEVSIESIETDGFPDREYLDVTGGHVVLSEADLDLRGEKGQDLELRRLTAPVVSESLLKEWQAALENGEPLDASHFRLLVSFSGEQVGRLWPKLESQAESGGISEIPPAKMDVVGETEPGEYMLRKPYDLERRSENFDLKQIRRLRFERHFNNLGRFLKNLTIGIGLMVLSVAAFFVHRLFPDDVRQDDIDWSADLGVGEDAPDGDDFDLD